MGKRVRWVVMIVLLAVFLASGGYVLYTMQHYREEAEVYELAAAAYVRPADSGSDASGATEKADCPPVTVDFESLLEKCSDIVGWIYCEDTVINYPVVQGEDNDYYLRRGYDGTYLQAGTIFIDANNMADFSDSSTIIYGHHMQDGSMFATLDRWAEQEFYDEHPVMWLLTPEQDYKIVLFSGYTTPALSDTYVIYRGAGAEFDEYLRVCAEKSDFETDVELDREGQYVLLSTCAYVYTDARYVLHGMLVPVEGQAAARQ